MMGVRIIEGSHDDGAVLYCSVSMWAFGPVFEDHDTAQAFLDWLGVVDPRLLTDAELSAKYHTFLEEKESTHETA